MISVLLYLNLVALALVPFMLYFWISEDKKENDWKEWI